MSDDGPTIKTIKLKSGKKRYRFVIDMGKDPDTGDRVQRTFTFDDKTKAKNERARIIAAKADGTLVVPSRETLNSVIDKFLKSIVDDVEENTLLSYTKAFLPVREMYGEKPYQELTKDDVVNLKKKMLTSGRRRGGKVGGPLSGRTVNYTLGRLRTLLDGLYDEGKVARNVAKLVRNAKHKKAKRGTWTRPQTRKFGVHVRGKRNEAAYRLTMYGVRRGEVLGQRWDGLNWGSFALPCLDHSKRWCEDCYGKGEDYELTTIYIEKARVAVNWKVIVKDPKSDNAFRRLPVDGRLAAALHDLWVIQQVEKLAAGPAYKNLGWIFVDSHGEPIHPEAYTDEYHREREAAGLPRIALRDQRSVSLTQMEQAGVPISILSLWAGHHDPAFTLKHYVQADAADLSRGMEVHAELHRSA